MISTDRSSYTQSNRTNFKRGLTRAEFDIIASKNNSKMQEIYHKIGNGTIRKEDGAVLQLEHYDSKCQNAHHGLISRLKGQLDRMADLRGKEVLQRDFRADEIIGLSVEDPATVAEATTNVGRGIVTAKTGALQQIKDVESSWSLSDSMKKLKEYLTS